MKLRINKRVILNRIPIILLLFFSIDTILFGTNKMIAMKWISRGVTVIALILLFAGLIVSKRSLRINRRIFPIFLIMSVIMITSSLVNGDGVEAWATRYLFFLTGYIVANICGFMDFVDTFINFVFVISIFALLMQAVALTFPRLILELPSVVNTQDQVFKTMILSSVEARYFGVSIIRASSIFWEPGAYSVYLTFALIFELFIKRSTRFVYVFVYIAALLVTFSTSGYLAVAAVMLGFVFSSRHTLADNRIRIVFIAMLGLLIAMTFFFENSTIRTLVFDKLTRESSSVDTRYSSVFNGMAVALEKPLLGVAGQTEQYMAHYVNAVGNKFSTGGVSITNTVVGQFASYGFIFGGLFVIGTISFAKHISKNLLEMAFLLLAILITYTGERFFSMFPFLWMFYGLKDSGFFSLCDEEYESVRLI